MDADAEPGYHASAAVKNLFSRHKSRSHKRKVPMSPFFERFQPVELKPVILHDVVILPERYGFSGAWCDGRPVALAHMCRNGRQYRRQAPFCAPVRTVEEPCIWGGIFQHHYGHFLIESMQSLYAFRQHPERRIVWRNATKESITPWQHTLFHLTGCDRNGYEFVNEATLFKDILFPVPGLMCDVCSDTGTGRCLCRLRRGRSAGKKNLDFPLPREFRQSGLHQ